MKLAIISDIHGNYTAFESVLAELKKLEVSKIVCLGDVLEGGHQPRKVLQKLKALAIPVVAGNADEEVLDSNSPREYHNEFEQRTHEIDKWTLSQLSSSDVEFVRSFKASIQVSLPQEKLMLCFHGSPRSNREPISSTTSEEQLSEILSGVRASVVAFGHSHSQMLRRYLKSILINPGSVGMPFEFETIHRLRVQDAYLPSFAEYAILDYSNDVKLGVEMRRTPINLEKLVSSIRSSGMPHADYFAKEWKRPSNEK